ncbi:hypothetical protein ABFS82_08G085200 [Erythranthe guttata]
MAMASPPTTKRKPSGIVHLLAKRELSGQAKGARQLQSWAEKKSLLRHGRFIPQPLPHYPGIVRAMAFSPDGKTIACADSNHSLRLIDCETGDTMRLKIHCRIKPNVVKFHPLYPEIVVSAGDSEVCWWDTSQGTRLRSLSFGGIIYSMDFHSDGEILAVAAGRKLYLCNYTRDGPIGPTIIVLQAPEIFNGVYFNPCLPLILTIEHTPCTVSELSVLDNLPRDVQYPTPFTYKVCEHELGMDTPLSVIPCFMYRNNSGRYQFVPSLLEKVDVWFRYWPHHQVPFEDREFNSRLTMQLRIWRHDMRNPQTPLDAPRLTIPHVVLQSSMGAHISPCGRFLAACVACLSPKPDLDDPRPQRVIYELRIYSLEKNTFGLVLESGAIRDAHCLTSIQFSPTSHHMVLAYGAQHGPVRRNYVIDGDERVTVHTILEIYTVPGLKIVKVLPCAVDRVVAACFHPSVGGGLLYATSSNKKLRMV